MLLCQWGYANVWGDVADMFDRFWNDLTWQTWRYVEVFFFVQTFLGFSKKSWTILHVLDMILDMWNATFLASFLSLPELVWRQWLCKLVGNNTRRGSWNPEALDNSRALLSDGQTRKLKFLAAKELLMKLRRLLTWYFAVRILLRRHARKQCRFLLLFAGVGRVV